MFGRTSSAGKLRQVLDGDVAEAAEGVATDPSPRRSRWLRTSLTLAVVSGIGIAAVSAFGSASTAATGLAFADQGVVSGVTAGRNDVASRASERAELSADQLAAQRVQLIEQTTEAIEDGQDAASLEVRESQLATAAAQVKAEAERIANLSKFLWPTAGSVSSDYGLRLHPILHYYRMHDGDDIGGKCGQPIYAAQSGTVVKAEMGYNGGSGNNVRIDHGDIDGHNVQTGYLHMTDYVVKAGQQVDKGELVGHVGSTGLSTACHLHFSAYLDGHGTDPMQFIGWNKEAKAKDAKDESGA
ncbi:MAG TPA: M23 family metallopeptidase [Propionicimonas sp.]|nr:M23 family metallopeptidase [Propionicimonas sp.]